MHLDNHETFTTAVSRGLNGSTETFSDFSPIHLLQLPLFLSVFLHLPSFLYLSSLSFLPSLYLFLIFLCRTIFLCKYIKKTKVFISIVFIFFLHTFISCMRIFLPMRVGVSCVYIRLCEVCSFLRAQCVCV